MIYLCKLVMINILSLMLFIYIIINKYIYLVPTLITLYVQDNSITNNEYFNVILNM